MELNEICSMYKIKIVDNLYCLNDIAKLSKNKISEISKTVDTIKKGNKYYVSMNNFLKVLFNSKSDECNNIINMIDSRKSICNDTFENKQIELLKLQLKIEKEKTKQLTIDRDIKILNAKLEFAKIGMDIEFTDSDNYGDDDDFIDDEINCQLSEKRNCTKVDFDEVELIDN